MRSPRPRRRAQDAGSRWPKTVPAPWKPCGCCEQRERRQSSAAARPCSNSTTPSLPHRRKCVTRSATSPACSACVPDPRIEWEDAAPPSQPRRQPPSQLRPAHGRRVPNANRRADPSLCRSQDPGGAVQTRDHALPEALRGPRDLPRTHRPIECLTNMRASGEASTAQTHTRRASVNSVSSPQ